VTKSKRSLQLYSAGTVVRTFRVALGLSPVEDKIRAGDRRTPEGDFYICMKNSHSQFYLSLELSYPNQKHADRGLRDGLITRAQYNQNRQRTQSEACATSEHAARRRVVHSRQRVAGRLDLGLCRARRQEHSRVIRCSARRHTSDHPALITIGRLE